MDAVDKVCFQAGLRGDVEVLQQLEEMGFVKDWASIAGCIEGLQWNALEYVLDSVSRDPRGRLPPYSEFREIMGVDSEREEFIDDFYRQHKSQWDAATCSTSGRR